MTTENKNSKKTNIIYWIFTGLIGLALTGSSIPDVISSPQAVEFMTKLGYPHYIIPFLGVAKILGVIAILIPGYPRIKEWAYAGLMFDLVGAAYSQVGAGGPPAGAAFMLIFIIPLAVSYIYYHKKLKAVA